MSYDAATLLKLLPAVYASRDAAQAVVSPGLLAPSAKAELATLLERQGNGLPLSASEEARLASLQREALAGPLASLLAVFAEQFQLLEEDLAQLLDDQFIETCAEWMVPYLGDLIGVRGLHDVGGGVGRARAEVAHTIGYRRRKGTVPVIADIAFDVTGWQAAAAEFFQRIITTQYSNHRRLHLHAAPSLRSSEKLETLGTAFDTYARSVDVRRIASRRGRHNIPNLGVFLWRLQAHTLSHAPAVRVASRRYRFNPLGLDQPLYTRPDPQAAQRTPLNVPVPITRRRMAAHLADYYPAPGATRAASIALYIDDRSGAGFERIPASAIRVSHLGDFNGSWGHLPPAGFYAIDPELGRLALPPGLPADVGVQVDFHLGACSELGGGEYERRIGGNDAAPATVLLRVPQDHATIAAAIAALNGAGVVEIHDSGRYAETLALDVGEGQSIEIRAVNGHRPLLLLKQPLGLRGAADSSIKLDGLVIAGHRLEALATAGNRLARLELSHCTLVPGRTLAPDLTPKFPKEPALVLHLPDLALSAQRCILGAIRTEPQATASLTDCVLDATAAEGVAYAGLDGKSEGATLSALACTVVGRVHARHLDASNSIFLSVAAAAGDWVAPVRVARRQEGCVRFCWLPPESRTPSRYRCLPESAPTPQEAVPRFTSLRYGHPAYAQLGVGSGAQLLSGADDESEPGVYHHLHAAQRETNLRLRLDEYLRAGLEAGIFYEN